MDKIRVLFLCTSAIPLGARWQKPFYDRYAGDKYEAYSAGIEPKEIHPLTKKVMSEIGIDISRQRSKALKEYMGKVHFGYLITVCSKADEQCPTTFPGMGQRLRLGFGRPG